MLAILKNNIDIIFFIFKNFKSADITPDKNRVYLIRQATINAIKVFVNTITLYDRICSMFFTVDKITERSK